MTSLLELPWTDGPWLAAECELAAEPASWMKPFRTRASFGRFDAHVGESGHPVTSY